MPHPKCTTVFLCMIRAALNSAAGAALPFDRCASVARFICTPLICIVKLKFEYNMFPCR